MNNGGRSQRALAVETNLDVQRSLLELNTLGTISLTQPVVKRMQKQKDGLIVVVSSGAGKVGKSKSLHPYCAFSFSLFCSVGAPTMAGYSACKHAIQVILHIYSTI